MGTLNEMLRQFDSLVVPCLAFLAGARVADGVDVEKQPEMPEGEEKIYFAN